MNKIGCCIPGGSFMPQISGETGASAYEILKSGYQTAMNAGFDYAETGTGLINRLTDCEFDRLCGDGVTFHAANSFVNLPIISTSTDILSKYSSDTMRRLARLGCRYVVFGSGAARRCPDGADDAALSKLYSFIRMCGDTASEYGMTFVIEPLNARETNFINTLLQGYDVVRELDHPNIRLLADAYHMSQNSENASDITDTVDMIVHIHISESDRSYPGKYDSEYLREIIQKFKAASYGGGISCECSYDDFITESRVIANYMNKTINGVSSIK